jgi:acyl-CoA thioester hydrolase
MKCDDEAASNQEPLITRRIFARVEFRHVDMMQVVHNAQYFNWFELGRIGLMEEVFPFDWAIEHRLATPVVSNHCEYLSPATYGDEIVITTRHRLLAGWEGRFVFDHSISNRHTKVELCNGRTATTLISMDSRRSLRKVPADAWERYRTLAGTT